MERQIAEKNFRGVLTDTLTKEMLDENEEKVTTLTLELNGYQEDQENILAVARRSIAVLEDISGVWMRVNLDIKKRFQKFLFPQGLLFDGEKFATIKLAYCISPNAVEASKKSLNVSHSGDRWNQIFTSLTQTYHELTKLGFTYYNGKVAIIESSEEETNA